MRQPKGGDSTTAEVLEALARPGCAVCHLTLRAVGRFLQAMAYEQVNDLQVRAELRASRGFCTTHAHRWLREARSVLGTALIYEDALKAAMGELNDAQPRGALRSLLTPRPTSSAATPCVACRAQQEAADRYVDALLEALDQAKLATSDGLCLPHTRRALERGGKRAEPLRARAQAVANEMIEHLREVIRKEDYRFRQEPRSDTDRQAPRRAIDWAAGLDGLTGSSTPPG
jgi:hypothetical protein